MSRLETDIEVDYSQYYLLDLDEATGEPVLTEPDRVVTRVGNGLVAVLPGGAFIFSGTYLGPIRLTLEVLDGQPGVELDGWDAAVEVSLDTTTVGRLRLSEWEDGTREDLPLLTPHGPGTYRVRVCARGRDNGHRVNQVTGAPVEEHRLQIWPAPYAPDVVYKQDRFAGPDVASQMGTDDT